MGLLRLILALSVVAAHVGGPKAFEPDLAVRLFFAISGFYMTLVLDGKYPPTGGGTRGFYANRALRLYPTYLVALLGALGVALVTRHRPGYYDGFFERYAGAGWLGLYALASQALIVGQDALLFVGYARGRAFPTRSFRALPEAQQGWRLALVPPAWSLSLEVVFYVLAPWLVRLRAGTLVALVAASYALRLGLRGTVPVANDPWSYRVFPFEIGTFLLGALAYRAYRRIGADRWETRAWPLAAVAVVATMAGLARLPESLFWAPVLMLAALPTLFAVTRRSPLDRSVGELSYPLYLVHYPLFNLFLAFGTPHLKVVTVVASILVSLAIVRWVDLPVDALRQRLARAIQSRGAFESPPAP